MPRRDLAPVLSVDARRPMSSRLQGRVDLAFRLIDDPDGPLVGFLGLRPMSLDMDVRPPGEADTLSVTLTPDALPFDLDIIAPKSMLISSWLFEHQSPEQCRHGDPGHFYGVVDDIERNRYSLRVGIEARDLTAIPLNAKMTEGQIASFSIDPMTSIESLVISLIRLIPNTHDWTVASYSHSSRLPIAPMIDAVGSAAPGPGKVARSVGGVFAEGTWHLSDVVGPHSLTVWTAICNVCARVGIVPDVRFISGAPVVVLIDGSQLQTSDAFRPFVRGDRRWRTIVDGDGLSDLTEHLALSASSRRPDFLQVESIHPVTGVAMSARWPPALSAAERKAAGEDRTDEGERQFVRGVTSEAALLRMARGGWEAMAHNQYSVEVTIKNATWTAGGSPSDPDLLGMGYGAACQLSMPAFERLAKVKGLGSPEEILAARQVDPGIIRRLVRAQERLGAFSLLYQVTTVKHSAQFSGGGASYECKFGMRRFLGTTEMPIFDSRAVLPREVA